MDPFLGTGTTAVVSKKLGRNYFGVEKEKNYKRIKNTKIIEDEYLDTIKNNRSKPRVPFGSLVELGIIKPGTEIFDQKIHKVAAQILGAESCNGWTFWYYKSGNSLKPIDELRNRLRSTTN